MEVGVDDDIEVAMDRGRFAYGAIADEPRRFVPFAVSVSRHKEGKEHILHPVLLVDDVFRAITGKAFVIPIYGNHLINFLDLFEFVIRGFPIITNEEEGAKILSAMREEIVSSNRFCQSTVDDVKRHPKKRVCYSFPIEVKTGNYIVEFSFDTQAFYLPSYSVLATAISLYDINQIDLKSAKLSNKEEAIGIVYAGTVVVTNALNLYRSLKAFDERLNNAQGGDKSGRCARKV